MGNKHEQYGTYYGELENFEDNDNLQFADTNTEDLVNKMKECGVIEILLDVEDDNDDYSDTLFFKTDENTDFKSLIVLIVNTRPDEFSEESDHHFRMWFD